MPLPYREFATWILSDLARRDRSKDREHVVFEGNHISYQRMRPTQGPGESDDDYKKRVRDFYRALPRASDFSLRIALAFRAVSKAGDKNLAAAQFVLQELNGAAERSRAVRNWLAKYGIAYRPLEHPLGTTRRHLRHGPTAPRLSLEDPRVETTRTQALRFIRECAEFDLLFEGEFKKFRSEHYRDAKLYAEMEAELRRQLVDNEAQLGSADRWTAMTTSGLARLLHQQGKFEEAQVFYRLALERWKLAAPLSEERRRETIGLIEQALRECAEKQAPHRHPILTQVGLI